MNQSQVQRTKSLEQSKLKYLSIRGVDSTSYPSLSLSPDNSDQVENHTLLNVLVATLVKYGVSGKVEPYLAESWLTSEDGLQWSFKIKEGFSCESGLDITAEGFRKSLLNAFRTNLQKSDKSEFGQLLGWQKFLDGKSDLQEGIQVTNNLITFYFRTKPTGLLNLLRMPYFGFWCPENFKNGKFIAADQFSSSGPYRLAKVLSPSRFLLSMRKNQPSYNPASPQDIEIGYGSLEELSDTMVPVIAKFVVEDSSIKREGYTAIEGPPLILQGIVLNPTTEFFAKEHNRKVFAHKLEVFKSQELSRRFSKGFYLDSPFEKMQSNEFAAEYRDSKGVVLEIALQYQPATRETKEFWERLFSFVLNGIAYRINYPEPTNPNWVKNVITNPNYAIRTSSVYPGAHHVLSVIQLMFCSKLGISFPDPSGEICKLTHEYIAGDRTVDGNYENLFNRALQKDNAVFPLFHARDEWLISNQVDISTMPTSIIHPLFEAIRFK